VARIQAPGRPKSCNLNHARQKQNLVNRPPLFTDDSLSRSSAISRIAAKKGCRPSQKDARGRCFSIIYLQTALLLLGRWNQHVLGKLFPRKERSKILQRR